VRKNSKKIADKAENSAEQPTSSSSTTEAAPAAKKRAAERKSAGGKAAAATKKSAGAAAKKPGATKRPAKKSASNEPSDADVRLRAYFIAERRVQMALQGDSARDWIEARQQLLQEHQANA